MKETFSNLADLYGERGYYIPSLFHIYINGKFDEDLGNLSNKDAGTFVHEYIHYLQNISTIYGLMDSELSFSVFLEAKSYLLDHKLISLPVHISPTPVYERMIKRKEKGYGNKFFDKTINKDSLSHKIIKSNIGDQVYNIHEISYIANEKQCTFEFGAFHIKEGMAHLCQTYFDSTVETLDIPYNLVEIIVKKLYPNIQVDRKKLICICYLSLFSQYPGDLFFTILEYAKEYSDKNGLEIAQFVYDEMIIHENGKKYEMYQYIDLAVDRFKNKLATNLTVDLDCIDSILKRVSYAKSHFPILTMLYDPKFPSISLFNDLVGYYGYPYIQTNEYNRFYFPQSVKNKLESSLDIMELVTQRAFLDIILEGKKECPLQYICLTGDTIEVDKKCYTMPWLHEDCPLSLFSEMFDLPNKIAKDV